MPFYLYPTTFIEKVPNDTMVIFWTYEFNDLIEVPILDELRNKIHNYTSKHFPFDRILLLTHSKNKAQIERVQKFFKTEGLTFTLNITDLKDGILGASFDENGKFEIQSSTTIFKVTDKTKANIISNGLSYIFENRGAIIKAKEHFHYILPSGKHSNVFIRVGNIFKVGTEINFIGFALLQYLRLNTKNIYCDTSSIIVAAQAAVNLKKILNNDFISPTINSFGSYTGIKKYKFANFTDSLFLISTSTTWDLSNLLYERILNDTDDSFIVTLFKPIAKIVNPNNQNSKFSVGKVLCDLKDIIDPNLIKVYNQHCLLCENNSTPISISGDEFLPAKQETISIAIEEKHKPKWFDNFLKHFVGKKYIICHKKKKLTGTDVRELYLDIDKLHKDIEEGSNSKYNSLFDRYLNKKLPASLKLIIYLDDTASATIARQVKFFFESTTNSNGEIQIIEYKDSPDFPNQIDITNQFSEGSILVVGSSISQSRTILTISRDLRSFYDKGFQLFYFVAFVRTYTASEFSRIKTNLLYSKEFGVGTHTFDSLFEISIPDERYRNDTPWTEELKLLSEQQDKFEENGIFQERLTTLLQKSSEGLINDLFWKSPDKKQLSLNPGFVFFKFDFRDLVASQADVYFTIASILHYLRTEYKDGHQVLLEQLENQCKILDPENFNRFNDPVIQACFLRAAQNIELDYSYDKTASKNMKDIIYGFVSRQQGASYEFLLALATKKVKLTQEDTQLLLDQLYLIQDSNVNYFLSIIQPKSDEYLRF